MMAPASSFASLPPELRPVAESILPLDKRSLVLLAGAMLRAAAAGPGDAGRDLPALDVALYGLACHDHTAPRPVAFGSVLTATACAACDRAQVVRFDMVRACCAECDLRDRAGQRPLVQGSGR